MTLTLYDSARRPVVLDRQLARGGQGVVYAVTGQPGMVGKVYLPKPDEELEEKLGWMVAHPPPDASAPTHATFAWPRGLLYDAGRHFLGYLMPYVQGAWPVLRVFNPRSREQTLPAFGRRYLYRAALNLARALTVLHEQDYIVGDLNESNVLVTRQAMITLIDTDSFQVLEPKNHRIIVYPCPVGKPEYTAPELQGEVLWTRQRRWEQDAFALGVMVFQLLMEGNHPFRARWLGPGDPPPLSERIQRGYFAYDLNQSGLVTPAPGVPPFDSLPPAIADLFRRCFVDGHTQPSRRPAAAEWDAVLSKTEYAGVPLGRATGRPAGQPAGAGAAAAGTRRGAGTRAGQPRSRPAPSGRRPATQPAPGGQFVLLGKQSLARLLHRYAHKQGTPVAPRDRMLRAMAQVAAAMLGGTTGPGAAARTATAAASASVKTTICPRCGQVNGSDEIYCQRCSYPLAGERPCPHCGRPMPQNTRYCTACATRV